MKKSVGKASSKAKSYTIPSGKATAGKKKFNASAYARMKTKVFGLAKKEDMGKA